MKTYSHIDKPYTSFLIVILNRVNIQNLMIYITSQYLTLLSHNESKGHYNYFAHKFIDRKWFSKI